METLAVDEAFLLNDNDIIRTKVFTLLVGKLNINYYLLLSIKYIHGFLYLIYLDIFNIFRTCSFDNKLNMLFTFWYINWTAHFEDFLID